MNSLQLVSITDGVRGTMNKSHTSSWRSRDEGISSTRTQLVELLAEIRQNLVSRSLLTETAALNRTGGRDKNRRSSKLFNGSD